MADARSTFIGEAWYVQAIHCRSTLLIAGRGGSMNFRDFLLTFAGPLVAAIFTGVAFTWRIERQRRREFTISLLDKYMSPQFNIARHVGATSIEHGQATTGVPCFDFLSRFSAHLSQSTNTETV